MYRINMSLLLLGIIFQSALVTREEQPPLNTKIPNIPQQLPNLTTHDMEQPLSPHQSTKHTLYINHYPSHNIVRIPHPATRKRITCDH